jgi:uncharacterized membrane-anchored protein YhcB (DUF1043 family)
MRDWFSKYSFAMAAFVVIVLIWLGWLRSVPLDPVSEPLSRNEMGDWFGALNALFSGLALGGVIVTLIMQRDELKRNTTELRDQVKKLDAQAAMLRHSAVLQSLPTLLQHSKRNLSRLLGDAAAESIETWDQAALDREIGRRERALEGPAAMLGLLQLRTDRTPEMNAEFQRLHDLVTPERRVIHEMKWRERLLFDLYSNYSSVARVDPDEPFVVE